MLEVRCAEGHLYVHVGLAVQQKVQLVKPLPSAKLAVWLQTSAKTRSQREFHWCGGYRPNHLNGSNPQPVADLLGHPAGVWTVKEPDSKFSRPCLLLCPHPGVAPALCPPPLILMFFSAASFPKLSDVTEFLCFKREIVCHCRHMTSVWLAINRS